MSNARTGVHGKLYDAIREIGETHFSIHLIEEVTPDKADERENFYISQQDAIENGYNSIYNGQSECDPFKEEMIRLYNEGKSKSEIDRIFGWPIGRTKDRFRAWHVPIRQRRLICKDIKGQVVGEYATINEARESLFPDKNLATVKAYISKATAHGTPAYRMFWSWEDVDEPDR